MIKKISKQTIDDDGSDNSNDFFLESDKEKIEEKDKEKSEEKNETKTTRVPKAKTKRPESFRSMKKYFSHDQCDEKIDIGIKE